MARAADRLLVADLSHLALAFDRGHGHQRLDAKFAQRIGDFFHFGGAALAMARHALKVVGNDLRPIEPRVIVLYRDRDIVDYTGARRREEAFQRQRLNALDHDAAHHLDGGGGADFAAGDVHAHAERAKLGATVWACVPQAASAFVARRMDGREHGDINIAGGAAKELCGLLLAAGRYRVDVEEVRLLRKDAA